MKGYIVDATYKTINDRSVICLFGRSTKGEAFITLHPYQAHFFIREKDLKKALKCANFEFKKTTLKNFSEEIMTKVLVDSPKDVPKLKKVLIEEGIDCYEADIKFPRRFLIDHKINGSIEVDGEFDYEGEIKVYKNPEIKPTTVEPKLKIMSIDIETDIKAKEIYSIAIVCEDYEKVLIRTNKKIPKTESFKDEEDILERFLDIVEEQDPDVITGWNVIDFDFKVIKERCKKLEIPLTLGRGRSPSRVMIKTGFFQSSKVFVEGRVVIDTLSLIRDQVKIEDYKLETVAQYYLKQGKVKVIEQAEDFERLWKEEPAKLAKYNLQDAILVKKIIEKSNALEVSIKKSLTTGLMLDEVQGSISSLDAIYLKKLRSKGYIAPSVIHTSEHERITGGYVMDSKPGIYKNVIVLDFKSLYPSIMRTFNIDPWAFGKKGIKAPNGATFSKEEGIMPEIIQELWEIREEYRKKKDEVGRYAIKILMNSFFGVLASPQCRFYSLDMANAITSFAQHYIKKTAKLIEKEGYEVIYSDTDSVFIVVEKNPEKVGKELEKKINNIFDKEILKEHKVKSFLELEFEKTFTSFIMPKLRGQEKGAKKRYAGLIKEELNITGMEAVRGDWTTLAKDFQKELLLKVFNEEEIAKFVTKFIADLKKGKYDDKLVLRKSLRKPLDKYTKITPPHVKAARKIKNFKGKVVEYVYTSEGVEPIQEIKGKYDYEYYINKQLKPVAESILVFFDLKFEEITSGQKSLFGY